MVSKKVSNTKAQSNESKKAVLKKKAPKQASKKVKSTKPVEQKVEQKVEQVVEQTVDETVEQPVETKQTGGTKKTKSVRSFKVNLPGTEEYSGRFTGSTPYQAANKALSKYFRTVEHPKPVITFSIKESTRGSKHNVYTYEGHRIKLETPVSYTIGEGNTIVKHHKNQLKKIKKADLVNQESL